jgi:hypothetical protein
MYYNVKPFEKSWSLRNLGLRRGVPSNIRNLVEELQGSLTKKAQSRLGPFTAHTVITWQTNNLIKTRRRDVHVILRQALKD